jgi:uncharacterized membrane protein YccC
VLKRLSDAASPALGRLRRNWWSLLQITVAAAVSYALATLLFHDEDAVFAPVAAVVSLSVTLGQRGRRAVQLVGGVMVGVLVADLVVLAFGLGPFRVGLAALLAAATAVAVGGTSLFVNQAAVAALVVATTLPAAGVVASATRLVDALIGCAVALAVNALLPHDPRRTTGRAGHTLFESLRQVLQQVATALETTDLELAERALRESRRLETDSNRFLDAVDEATDTVRFAPLPRLRDYDVSASRAAADRLDLMVGDAAALTRGAANMVRHGQTPAPDLIDAVRHLADALGDLVPYLQDRVEPDRLRELALLASERATSSLKTTATLASCMFVGQVRTTTVDVLVITGLDQPHAVELLERRAGTAASVRFGQSSGEVSGTAATPEETGDASTGC